MIIIININKAKEMAHDARRIARATEFAPLDIKSTIPSEAVSAEISRQLVRDKFNAIQTALNVATTTQEIKKAMQW